MPAILYSGPPDNSPLMDTICWVVVSPKRGLFTLAALVISSILPLSMNCKMRVAPKPPARPNGMTPTGCFTPLMVPVNVIGSHVGLPRDLHSVRLSRGVSELARCPN